MTEFWSTCGKCWRTFVLVLTPLFLSPLLILGWDDSVNTLFKDLRGCSKNAEEVLINLPNLSTPTASAMCFRRSTDGHLLVNGTYTRPSDRSPTSGAAADDDATFDRRGL